MGIRPQDKLCRQENDNIARIEKFILRQAFDEKEADELYLPHKVL